MHLKARLTPPTLTPELIPKDSDLLAALKAVLGAHNVCSKESFVRMYDHEVQGQSVLKPFQGAQHDGPGNAGVIAPVFGSKKGVAVACGIAPKYSDLDAYSMMAASIDEAVRNLVCVGAKIGMIAGLDNFCWPDPVESAKTPDGQHKLAQLVLCCEALYECCVVYDIPLISGKDSMKNDYKIGDVKISIPPTVLFTAAAVLDDINRVVSMDLKRAGDVVYVLGETKNEMGGSEYLTLKGQLGATAPTVNCAKARTLYERVHEAMQQGLVASCHDCSDGGLGVTLAETAFAGDLGINVDITSLGPNNDAITLFSESQSRFVVSVSPENAKAFESILADSPCYRLGEVCAEPLFRVQGHQGCIEASIAELKTAWQEPLKW